MMPLVRKGDPLRPFGGEVLEGHYLAFGKPVACMGDAARCNKHGLTRIAGPRWTASRWRWMAIAATAAARW